MSQGVRGWGKVLLGLVACMQSAGPLLASSDAFGEQRSAEATSSRPAPPTNLRLSTLAPSLFGLEWDDNSDNETLFRIERRTFDGPFQASGFTPATEALIENLQPDTLYIFRVQAENAAGVSAYSNELAVSTEALPSTCVPDAESLCLRNNRFKVKAYWESEQGGRGRGQAVQLTSESGYFWFFNQDNVEVLVKLLNGCVPNFRYWMFAAGLTDQRVIWTVTDTQTGYVKTYQNPLKTQFAPALDVDFAPCP